MANLEHDTIQGWITAGASVLDLGCGNGELLLRLEQAKQAKVQGIEIDEQAIYRCVAKGLCVLHGDIDSGLTDYRDNSFDYVILNESLQQVKNPELVLKEALRVGKKVIVGFPNFTHYSARFQIFFKGTVPVTKSLPYEWHSTPNLHFLSTRDFVNFCKKRDIAIEHSAYIGDGHRVKYFPNLRALAGLFVISGQLQLEGEKN